MTDPNTSHPASHSPKMSRALSDLLGVGTAWARYGLNIGSSALVTSAVTLRTTARALEAISERLGAEHGEEPPAPSAEAEEPNTDPEKTAEQPAV